LLLADFGLAKFSTLTSVISRSNYGTPIYMAPEHWDGNPVPATDQYALAVMAYELLTGRPPFLGNHQQVMYQHLEVQPQLPSKLNPQISKSVDTILLRALAKRPGDRFPSISAFADAFEQALLTPTKEMREASVWDVPPGTQRRVGDRASGGRTAMTSSSGAEPLSQSLFPRQDANLSDRETPAQHTAGTALRGLTESERGQALMQPSPGSADDHSDTQHSVWGTHNPELRSRTGEDLKGHPQGGGEGPLRQAPRNHAPTRRAGGLHQPRSLGGRGSESIPVSLSTSSSLPGGQLSPIYRGNKIPLIPARDRFTSSVLLLIGLLLVFVTVGGGIFAYMGGRQETKAPATIIVTDQPSGQATVSSSVVPTIDRGATATSVPQQNPYLSQAGTLAVYDALQDNLKGNNWDEVTNSQGSCQFTGGAYRVTASAQTSLYLCAEEKTNFSNFVFQVQMTIIAGDYGGIVFRVDTTHTKFFYFRIGKDGSYALVSWGDKSGKSKVLKSGTSLAMKTGFNQANIIAVVASGSELDLYVNHQFITYANDSTLSQGQLGVCAEDVSNASEIVYRDAIVWTL